MNLNLKKIKMLIKSTNMAPLIKDIKIKNISFKYPNRTEQILENVNLIVNKNSFVGIGGESGSGKSTLIDIIMGILKPNSGEVLVDNKSIFNSVDSWQKN